MKRQYVIVKDNNGKDQFLIWNCYLNHFETHSGNQHWYSWNEFHNDFNETEDIEFYSNKKIDCIDEFDWNDYEFEAPENVKKLGKIDSRPVEAKKTHAARKKSPLEVFKNILLGISFIALIIALPAYFFTDFILRKTGVIEEPKLKTGHEKYLERVKGCKETKTVYSKLSKKHPTFQIHVCDDGTEKIWKYEIEVIEKESGNRWIIE